MRRELIGRQTCAGELSSGERMLAGGRRFPGGCIPAKPPWSEVIIFVYLLLRQSSPYRRWCCAGEFSSGERMFAGGHRFPRGRNPAKPPWSEVMIFLEDFLRQGNP